MGEEVGRGRIAHRSPARRMRPAPGPAAFRGSASARLRVTARRVRASLSVRALTPWEPSDWRHPAGGRRTRCPSYRPTALESSGSSHLMIESAPESLEMGRRRQPRMGMSKVILEPPRS